MKRLFFLGAFSLWLYSCNSNSAGSGGNPSQDSVVPTTGGTSNDKGDGSTTGGSSDPLNGGTQTTDSTGRVNGTGAGNGNTTTISTDTSAFRGNEGQKKQ